MTKEELINVFKYIVKKCDMLINNGDYEADAYTQDTVEDIAELCNHILDGDYGKLVEAKDVQEDPVSEGLEEAADKYSNNDYNYFDVLVTEYDGTEHLMDDKVFIKDAFNAGANWHKEQMMAKAIDGYVIEDVEEGNGDFLLSSEYLPKSMGLKDRQKVKVIVIKDD